MASVTPASYKVVDLLLLVYLIFGFLGELHRKRTRSVARKLYLYLLKHDTTLMAREIAAMAGMSAVGFSGIMSKFDQDLRNNKLVSKQCAAIRTRYA